MSNTLWKSEIKKIFGYMVAVCGIISIILCYFVVTNNSFVIGLALFFFLFLTMIAVIGLIQESRFELEVNKDLYSRGYRHTLKNISTINVGQDRVNFLGFFLGDRYFSYLPVKDKYSVFYVSNGDNMTYYIYSLNKSPVKYIAIVDDRVKPYRGGVQVFV